MLGIVSVGWREIEAAVCMILLCFEFHQNIWSQQSFYPHYIQCYFWHIYIVSFQCVSAVAEEQKCSVNVTEADSGLESITLRLTTEGQQCHFTVLSVDSSSVVTHCVEEPKENDTFQCQVVSLEPGTSYALQIMSTTDEQRANVTLQTSELGFCWGLYIYGNEIIDLLLFFSPWFVYFKSISNNMICVRQMMYSLISVS